MALLTHSLQHYFLCVRPSERHGISTWSAFVDHHLPPLVEAIPSYIRDTTNFLLKVKSLTNLPSDTLLVTLDVSSLYTSIPHHQILGEASLEAFVEELNQARPTIKFTAEWSDKSIPFFDTHVSLESGCLCTDLFVKPTDTYRYLAANGCHPRHCMKAIPGPTDASHLLQ